MGLRGVKVWGGWGVKCGAEGSEGVGLRGLKVWG